MPPKQSHSAGTNNRGQGSPRDGGGLDRDRMSGQLNLESGVDYHNLPEIPWNVETFNFDAGDFTNQNSTTAPMRNTNQVNDQPPDANSLQQASGAQKEPGRQSPPKKVLRPCSHCGKTFSRSYDLNRHESSHSDERRFACEYPGCNKRYKLRQDLKAHERSAHEGRGGGGAVVLGHWRGYEDRLYSM